MFVYPCTLQISDTSTTSSGKVPRHRLKRKHKNIKKIVSLEGFKVLEIPSVLEIGGVHKHQCTRIGSYRNHTHTKTPKGRG